MEKITRRAAGWARALVIIGVLTTLIIAVDGTANGAIRTPTASGAFHCGAPGSTVITWSVHNYVEAPVPIVISSAVMSGAASGAVTLSPSSVPPDGDATATVTVDGATVGEILLSVTMSEPFETTFVGRVMLDGSCAAPASSEPTTMTPSSVVDVSTSRAIEPGTVLPTYVG